MHEITIPFSKSIRTVVRDDRPTPIPGSQTITLPSAATGVGDAAATSQQAMLAAQAALAAQANATQAAEEQRRLREELAQLKSVLANIVEASQELKQQQQQRLEEMQRVAVELAVAVAAQVIHAHIAADDVGVQALVQKLAAQLDTSEAVTIALHPADLLLLQRQLGEGEAVIKKGQPIRLLADASLPRGSCRAEAGDTCLLTRVQDQLDDLRQHLLDALPDAQVDRRKGAPGEPKLGRFPDRRETA